MEAAEAAESRECHMLLEPSMARAQYDVLYKAVRNSRPISPTSAGYLVRHRLLGSCLPPQLGHQYAGSSVDPSDLETTPGINKLRRIDFRSAQGVSGERRCPQTQP